MRRISFQIKVPIAKKYKSSYNQMMANVYTFKRCSLRCYSHVPIRQCFSVIKRTIDKKNNSVIKRTIDKKKCNIFIFAQITDCVYTLEPSQ